MKHCDAAVIGGGVLGCFAARNLRRWNISAVLLEQAEDVCTGITRANSAIVYAGYDNKPGSRKAEFAVRGNADFDRVCRELEVPFSRCGSLLVTYEDALVDTLRRKWEQGIQNGVPGLRLLTGQEAEAMEPMLKPGVAGALYAPTTGTVNPWRLGIAAFENAVDNGVVPMLGTAVTAIEKTGTGYLLRTTGEAVCCKVVLNCAGLYADRVRELLFPPDIRLHWDGAEYLVLDSLAQKPEHIIFLQAKSCGKGITAIPCTEALLPGLDMTRIIRSFAAVRPNPYRESGESLHDFGIDNPAPGFYSLIGIKTPGLTCANELGMYLAGQAAAFLDARRNPDFNPHRRAISKTDDPEIVCQCENVTCGEILEAIRRGAASVDAVKRRVGSGMGRCQGSRCSFAIERLLEEAHGGTC